MEPCLRVALQRQQMCCFHTTKTHQAVSSWTLCALPEQSRSCTCDGFAVEGATPARLRRRSTCRPCGGSSPRHGPPGACTPARTARWRGCAPPPPGTCSPCGPTHGYLDKHAIRVAYTRLTPGVPVQGGGAVFATNVHGHQQMAKLRLLQWPAGLLRHLRRPHHWHAVHAVTAHHFKAVPLEALTPRPLAYMCPRAAMASASPPSAARLQQHHTASGLTTDVNQTQQQLRWTQAACPSRRLIPVKCTD